MAQEETVGKELEESESDPETLDANTAQVEESSRNYQYTINEFYRSNKFHEQMLGFWGKLIYEFSVKAVPIGILVIVGILLRLGGFFPFEHQDILMWGGGISASITFVGWCMSEGKST